MADQASQDMVEEVASTVGVDTEMGDGETEAGATSRELPFSEDLPEDPPAPRTSFLQYLSTPTVTLLLGSGDNETTLTAHQGLLEQSPYFAEACAEFADDGSPRQIELANEDLGAVGSFLEFLYTGDYFPKKMPGQRLLEADPSIPKVDESGDQLLKHARVYTLGEKFGLIQLKNLATSKIHCVSSTAKGEIAYARFVYEFTPKDDTLRAPVANFWATRSHTLRSEAEEEFRSLCLEFPQFGYDVLTRVLDDKLKRERNDKLQPIAGSARKRPRHSNV